MGTTVFEQEAPSGRQIVELLTARLPESGDMLTPNVITSAIPMLIDRFMPKVRQQLFDFVRDRPADDMALAKELILSSSTSEIVTHAVLSTLDTARIVNSGRGSQSTYSAFREIKQAVGVLGLMHKMSSLSARDLTKISATHFVTVIGGRVGWRLVKDIVPYLESHPDFLRIAAPSVMPLIAAVEFLPAEAELSLGTVIEVVEMMHQCPSEGFRVAEAIRVHKGFNKGLVEQLLASDRTPLESGVL
jgi:hypothetical protein